MRSYDVFCELLKERGLKAADVSKATGISTSTLTDWKKGRTTPKMDKMQAIADYFGVSVDYFCGLVKTFTVEEPYSIGIEIPAQQHLTDREEVLLQYFRQLSDKMQHRYLDLIESTAREIQQNASPHHQENDKPQ